MYNDLLTYTSLAEGPGVVRERNVFEKFWKQISIYL